MAIDLGYVTLPDSQLVWRLFHWHNTFQIVLYATAGGGGGGGVKSQTSVASIHSI